MTDSASDDGDEDPTRAILKEINQEAPDAPYHSSDELQVADHLATEGKTGQGISRPALVRLLAALVWPMLIVLLLVCYPSAQSSPSHGRSPLSRKPARLAPFRFAAGWPRAERSRRPQDRLPID